MTRDLRIHSMLLEIDGVKSLLIIARCHGVLVATLELFYARKIAEIQNLFVRPDYRRRGIGTKLIQTARDFAREKGCKSAALAVGKSNESAVAFYRRCGFQILEQRL